MLNVGQVVYDYTNKRVIIYAGTQILQDEKTHKCTVEFAFILKDGTFIHIKDKEKVPFNYTHLMIDYQSFIGSLVSEYKLDGHYFGIINSEISKVKAWAKKAIEEAEVYIDKNEILIPEIKKD